MKNNSSSEIAHQLEATTEIRTKRLAEKVADVLTRFKEDISGAAFRDANIRRVVSLLKNTTADSLQIKIEKSIQLDVMELASSICIEKPKSKIAPHFLAYHFARSLFSFVPTRKKQISRAVVLATAKTFFECIDSEENRNKAEFPGYHLCVLAATLADDVKISIQYRKLIWDIDDQIDSDSVVRPSTISCRLDYFDLAEPSIATVIELDLCESLSPLGRTPQCKANQLGGSSDGD